MGFGDWRMAVEPPLTGMPEMGWVLSPEAHGRGLATEAVRAALAWMDGQDYGQVTTCVITCENTASMRVAEKVGYREHARSVFRGFNVAQLRRYRA